ncbi:MAG TPA: phage portal protein [Planctomycetes bacterium]|nr:phage portal protein [Planctomycetota bacterium]
MPKNNKLSEFEAEALRASVDRQIGDAQKGIGTSRLAYIWEHGLDLPDGSASKSKKPYAQVELVFACVTKLIGGIAGLPPVITDTKENIIESGPAYELLFNNPAMSFERFVTATVGHYALSRDVFWIFGGLDGNEPDEIMVVSGTQMHAVTHNRRPDGELIGWEFRGTGGRREKFSIDEVYQWKNFNPYDRFHGAGPAAAAKLSIDYSYAASMFNASALDNGAEPGIILTAQNTLNEDQVRLLRNQFNARHKGPSKAKRTAVLSGGMDAKTVALNMVDMDVANLTEKADRKICAAFEVPPALVGLATEAQYSHGPAQRDFVFNTIIPLARLFAGHITSGILSRFKSSRMQRVSLKEAGLYNGSQHRPLSQRDVYRSARHKAAVQGSDVFFWFDSDQHPVVRAQKREIAENVLKFTQSGVTLNDLINAHDLPYAQNEWGDEWWIGMGQVPASYTLEAGLEGITGPSLPEEPEEPEDKKTIGSQIKDLAQAAIAEKDKDAQRLRIWRNWVISWAGLEREYKEAMRKYFLRQQRILLTELKKAINETKAAKASAGEIIARVAFDLIIENKKIKVINHTHFKTAAELGVRQSLAELGISGDERDKLAARTLESHRIKGKLEISTAKITNINKTTKKLVSDQLKTGLENQEGLDELAGRVQNVLGSNRARALTIARTQVAGGVDTGRHEGMTAAGVDKHGWLDSRDSVVRPSHKAAGITYAQGIPIDQPFIVSGESLMHPGDSAGSAANIINCRCVEIAISAGKKALGPEHYGNLKFYSYQDMLNEKK